MKALYKISFVFSSLLVTMVSVAQSGLTPIQVTGVVKNEASETLGQVIAVVKNKNVGVMTGANGVFSIVCYKGDTITLASKGYMTKEFVIPKSISGKYYSSVQVMSQDTFYLPEVKIYTGPTFAQFDYLMRYGNVPDDQYQIALRNVSPEVLRQLRITLPKSGPENQAYMQQQEAYRATYYGQQAPQGIFNPLKWNEFFQSLKKSN